MLGAREVDGGPGDGGRPDAFISYARTDGAFVRELDARLKARGKDVWVDWEDIRPSADWWATIQGGIDAARAFVAVLSPDLVASEVCRGELAHAVASNKRVVPVLRHDVDRASAPPELTAPNWLFCREGDDLDAFVDRLVETLETDLDWLDAHARLLVRAREWERGGRDRSLLLRGNDLHAAEEWLARQGSHREAATPLQADYVVASRRGATRTQRMVLGGVLVALAVALALAVVAFLQRSSAIANERTAVSRGLAVQARALMASDLQLASLLALEAWRVRPTADARDAALAAVQRTDRIAGFLHAPDGTDTGPMSFSANGHTLAVAGNRRVRIWDVRTRRVRRVLPAAGNVSTVALSPSGDRLAEVVGQGTLVVLSLRGRTKRLSVPQPGTDFGNVVSVAFAPDSRSLVVGSIDDSIRLYRLGEKTTFQVLDPGGLGEVSPTVGFAEAGRLVVAVLADGRLRTWRTRDGGPVATRKLGLQPFDAWLRPGTVTGVVETGGKNAFFPFDASGRIGKQLPGVGPAPAALSADGHTFALADARKISLIDVGSRRRRFAPLTGTGGASLLAFSPDGKLLAAAEAQGVTLWRVGPETLSRPVAFAGVVGLAFVSQDRLAVAGDLKTVVWDTRRDRPIGRPVGLGIGPWPTARELAASQTSVAVASYGFDSNGNGVHKGVLLLNRGGRVVANLGNPDARGLAFDPGASRLAAGGAYRGLSVRSLGAGGAWIGPFGDTKQPVWDVAFDPHDPDLLASASADGVVTLWNLRDRPHAVATLRGHSGAVLRVAFTPDGETLASGSDDGTVRLWTLHGQPRSFGEPLSVDGPVDDLAISPDGHTLAVVSRAGTVTLWDLPTRRQLGNAIPFPSAHAVAFSPDGSLLAVAGSDLVTQPLAPRPRLYRGVLWTDRLADVAARLCPLVSRNLSSGEWREFEPGRRYQRTCPQWPSGS
jgi:WD40 repeat protein